MRAPPIVVLTMLSAGIGRPRPTGWATKSGHWCRRHIVIRSNAPVTRSPPLRGIHWVFPEVKGWSLKQAVEPKWERTYNLLWQRAALRHARDLHRQVGFDVVHHLTWAGIRAPTFLGALTAPLIIGPIGGGETSPSSLRDEIGFTRQGT